jgi:hypothetical protein
VGASGTKHVAPPWETCSGRSPPSPSRSAPVRRRATSHRLGRGRDVVLLASNTASGPPDEPRSAPPSSAPSDRAGATPWRVSGVVGAPRRGSSHGVLDPLERSFHRTTPSPPPPPMPGNDVDVRSRCRAANPVIGAPRTSSSRSRQCCDWNVELLARLDSGRQGDGRIRQSIRIGIPHRATVATLSAMDQAEFEHLPSAVRTPPRILPAARSVSRFGRWPLDVRA